MNNQLLKLAACAAGAIMPAPAAGRHAHAGDRSQRMTFTSVSLAAAVLPSLAHEIYNILWEAS